MTNTITFDRELAYEKLIKLLTFLPDKTLTPYFDSIRVTVVGEVAELLVSDAQTQCKLYTACKSKGGDFSFCIPAALFIKTVGLFRENNVSVAVNGNKINLKSGKSSYKITTDVTPDIFPCMEIADVTGEVSLQQYHLKKGLKAANIFVGKGTNEVLNGIHVAFTDKMLVFTGAEQQLLCRYACNPVSVTTWTPIMLPVNTAKKVVSMLTDRGEMNVVASKDKICFTCDSDTVDKIEVVSTLKEYKYPDSEALFKASVPEYFVSDTMELQEALKRLRLYTFDEVPSVNIKADGTTDILMQTKDDLTGKMGEEVLSVQTGCKPFAKSYHIDQLLKILKEIPDKNLALHYNADPRKPSQVLPIQENPDAEDNYKFLIVAMLDSVA